MQPTRHALFVCICLIYDFSVQLCNALSISESLQRRPVATRLTTQQQFSRTSTIKTKQQPTLSSDEQVLDMLKKSKVMSPWMTETLSTKACNVALSRLAQLNSRNGGLQASQLLQYMLDQSAAGRADLRPNILSLNTALAALSNSAEILQVESAQVADEIVDLWQKYFSDGKVDQDVDIISYNTLISAHVRAKEIRRAEGIFNELKENIERSGADKSVVVPDAISYATLMRGHALQGSVARVEALFQEMQDSEYIKPTVECFNELLYAYSKSKATRRAEESLKLWIEEDADNMLFRPDLRSFNIVLYSLSRNKEVGSITRAEKLFARMPQPDAVSYSTLVSVYCNHLSGRLAVDATERVFKRARSDPNVNITTTFVANLLYSLAAAEGKEIPACAEKLVITCIKTGVEPDIVLYNALIYCWSKSGDYEAARRVRQILSTIEKHPKLRPNLKTYTNVLDCFAKSRELTWLDSAKSIIEKIERYGPSPNVHAYTSLIQNYARSRLPYKALEASKILKRMKKSENPQAQPNIVTYNAVLNAAEHSDPTGGVVTEEALKVACLTFDEIRTSPVEANHVTYGTFLGVLGKLMPAVSRQEIVGLVFRRACKEGQVSPLVLRKLLQAVDTPQQYAVLLNGFDDESIPLSWKAKVREVKARDTP